MRTSVVIAVSTRGWDLPKLQFANSRQPHLSFGRGMWLRPWILDDASTLLEAFRDGEISRWHAAKVSTTRDASDWIRETQESWREQRSANWAVCTSHQIVGRVALSTVSVEQQCAEVSYWVLPAHRGLGHASAAVRRLTSWCFEEAGFNRLEIQHSVFNQTSCRVASNAGFVIEGIRRQAVRHSDGWHDMHLHGLCANGRPTPDIELPPGITRPSRIDCV